MTSKQYEKLSRPFRTNTRTFLLTAVNRLLSACAFFLYPVLLLFLFCQKKQWLLPYIVFPAVFFFLVSVMRKRFDCKRPYEKLDICPLIQKEKKGQSFPSRHVFSIFLIGTIWYYVAPAPGIFLWISGFLLGCVRVIGGVHFPRDVFFGALLGLLLGWMTHGLCLLFNAFFPFLFVFSHHTFSHLLT